MADELVFYTNPRSRGRIVRWMLEEVGQPYRTEVLDYGTTMKAPAYLAINPMGKVPALAHGDAVVTECAAICAYLADAFPQAEPGAAAGRSPACALLSLDVLHRRSGRVRGQQQGAWLSRAAGARADDGIRQRRSRMQTLETAVSQADYLVGDKLHRRRPLCRLPYRLRHDVRHDRQAPGVRTLCRAAQQLVRPTSRATSSTTR